MSQSFTTASTAPATHASPQVLLSSIDVALKRLAGKHWAQVEATMIAQGFAPEKGGVLVLPKAEEETAPGYRPAWVRFSATVNGPTLINLRAAGLAV